MSLENSKLEQQCYIITYVLGRLKFKIPTTLNAGKDMRQQKLSCIAENVK